MNSRKKRKEQQPMVEDLIVTEAPIDVKASEKSKNRSNSTLSDTKYDPRIPELDDNVHGFGILSWIGRRPHYYRPK